MAQAAQSAIIDLTGEFENDDSIARAHAACEKAFAAASQLNDHLESFQSSKPTIYQGSNEDVGLTGNNSFSAPVPKTKTPPRLGTFLKPVGSEQLGPKTDEKIKAITQSNSSVPNPGISAAPSALSTAASRPVGSASMLNTTAVKEQLPKEITSVSPRTNAFTSRTPRSAAISAKQSIAEACNEFEKWVNKDPDLRPQQAAASTPRRLGRPNDDLDEWSPNSNMKGREEEREEVGRMISNSPTPWAGKHDNFAANGETSLSQTQGIPVSPITKKRKYSEPPQTHGSPVKVARLSRASSSHHESTTPSSAEPANNKNVHDVTSHIFPAGVLKSVLKSSYESALELKRGFPMNSNASAEDCTDVRTAPLFDRDLNTSRLDGGVPSETTVKTNIKLPSEPKNASSRKNSISARPTTLHMHEKIDPRLQRGYPVNPTASDSGPYSISPVYDKYTALFESVVYPAIKRSKKRHNDTIPREDLDAIGKIIVDEVLERLATQMENSNQLDEDTRKKIKRFVKKSFSRRVRKANTRSSHKAATPVNELNFKIDDLTSSRGKSVLSLDPSEDASSNRANAINENEDSCVPRQPHPTQSNQQPLSPLKQSLDESSTSFFPPGFDRGRYPALRRRRGNKYYTPTRTPKTTSKLKTEYSLASTDLTLAALASNLYDNNLGKGDGKDQVRLPKALANKSTTVPARATQLTAIAPNTENKRTPPIENPASEGLASITKATDMRHNLKARRELSSTQSTQQISRKRLLEEINHRKELRPILRSKPATALDPGLEHVIAVLVSDTSKGPSQDRQKYTITPTDQMQLVTEENIVKFVGPSSKDGKPKLVRIETKVVDPLRQQGRCISSLLRNRELGLSSRGRHVATVRDLWQLKTEMLEPWKNWKGASGDVVAVAWHPDSNVYAFGAAAHTNVEDIQYNRPCNLLLGNLTSNQIRELPDHRIDRPKPDTIPNGPNANPAVYDACDPKVYETVTSIAFSPVGDRMFTASHDRTVKIWDISGGNHQCLSTLDHEAWVTSIEISEHRPEIFATASKCVKDSVRIYRNSSWHGSVSASRAEMKPEWKIYPECLRWGSTPYTSHLLLAGFQQWEQQGDLLSGGGQLCLWDAYTFESIKVTPSSQSVYAAAWHPTQPFFATGGAPGNNIIDKVNTKTVVRTWDVRTPKRYQVEYECPATDMQDITFAPSNVNIVTAGCTDGSSYVWDWRWPDQVLHRLKHGRPLAELDHTREREEADTGVMLSLWGPGGSLFYTGSSDGMIKAWDVRRHPNDVLVSNVAHVGISIQSGAFSPDGQNLLVGDAEGGIHILSSAPCAADGLINLVRASDGSGAKLDQNDDNPGTEGIEAARSLIESGQLGYHKELGVGQGLNYKGPYATYARKKTDESSIGRLRKKFEKRQPISKRGEKRWDIAIPMTSLLYERKQTLDAEKDGEQMALDGLSERKRETSQRSKGGETLQIASRAGGANSLADGKDSATVAGGDEEDGGVEYNTIAEEEMIEENFWWVRMGEEEIEQARAGRVRC